MSSRHVSLSLALSERATQGDGLSYAAPGPIAADLLSSAGRGPNVGEKLISWMRANEGKWRL